MTHPLLLLLLLLRLWVLSIMQKDLHWVGVFADLVGIGAQERLEIVVGLSSTKLLLPHSTNPQKNLVK